MSPGSGAAAGALAGRPELLVFALVGLLGGVHCLGMCGPLVTAYADRFPGDRGGTGGVTWFALRQHALFNAGRTASYATIGALLGALGGLAFEVAALAAAGDAVRAATGVLVGVAILAVGASYLLRGRATGVFHDLPVAGRAFRRVSGVLAGRVEAFAGGPGIVALGAVHGLLPCPLLYPAFLYAFATGSALSGGAALLALGLGTFPALFAYGAALGTLAETTRIRLHRALGAAFLLLATVPLAHALGLLGVPVPHVPLPHPTP